MRTHKRKITSYPLQVNQHSIATPSTLLIPACKLKFFVMRKEQFQSINAYFIYLLATFAKNLKQYQFSDKEKNQKWKKQYQNQGLCLKKTCFLPDPSSWEAFRQLSNCYGISICNLFVMIMELDFQSWVGLGCPEDLPKALGQFEYRKTYPFVSKKIKDSKFTCYSFQKIQFEEKILTRGGYFWSD